MNARRQTGACWRGKNSWLSSTYGTTPSYTYEKFTTNVDEKFRAAPALAERRSAYDPSETA